MLPNFNLVPHSHYELPSTCNWKDYLIQNSQAVKKECGPEKGYGEKDVKSKVAAKKWL